MTLLALAFHDKFTLCAFDGTGVGVDVPATTPSPDMDSSPGEVRFGLNNVSVAADGPATFGVNHTWNVTFWFGANENPGERSE
jgi:hypothetical protein